jgi:hypothetical protein
MNSWLMEREGTSIKQRPRFMGASSPGKSKISMLESSYIVPGYAEQRTSLDKYLPM